MLKLYLLPVFAEVILEVLNTPTGLAIVEKSALDLKSGINVNKC